MNKIFARVRKIKTYKIVIFFVLITFFIVCANSYVFHIMEEHHHHIQVILINFITSIILVASAFLVFYIYFRYIEKQTMSTKDFDELALNLVLDNLDTCIYMTEIETNKIIFMNKKMREEFGGGDFIGKTCWKVLQEGFSEQCDFCPVFTLRKDSTKPCIWEEHNTVTKKYYENTDTLIKWIDGSMVHMQHSVNITERKMAEMKIKEALSKLESVMFNYPGVIMTFDTNRECSFSSGSNFDESFDFVKECLLGKNNSSCDFEEYKNKMDLAYSGACSHWILDVKDGSYNCFLSPIIDEDNKTIGVIFAANDVSQTVKMQKELEKAIQLAEQASKAKSEFLSRMSHEMRTPMNAILGMAKIAQESTALEKIQYCLDKIDGSSKHLLGLINDVLDMSKIEANKFVLEHAPFNIEKMIMNVCNIILDKVEEKKQTLDIIIGQNIHQNLIGDELRLSQVLANLLSNAVKFTPIEGKITLTVNEIETQEKYSVVRFSVADTGIGISEEQQRRLFSSFEQADETIARKYGGTGLGLAISKSIVEKMNGKIWVESEQNQGSNFIFEVRTEISKLPDSKTIIGKIKPSDMKVLIVDDSENIRKYFLEIMEKFDINADAATNGVEAIDMIDKAGKHYDVIFLDWHMPEMDGIETAKRINTKIDKNTTIIMLSDSEWHSVEDAAKNVGIQRYISKPLFPSAILNSINEVVGQTVEKLKIKSVDKNEKPDFSNFSLLLVDDVEINRYIFKAFLESTKLKIDTAENGLVAVEKFKNNPDKYDTIIMDIQMPEMDGYEATRTIRALEIERAKTIPIIAMTANAFKEDVDRCLESGMNDHLSKPIDKTQVLQKLLHIFETQKNR